MSDCAGGMPGGGTQPLMSQIGIGGLLEVEGGIAIMLGLLTRPVAFILSGEMAVAYWQFHAPNATSCFVSSSCTWRHAVPASGASMN